MFRENQTVPTRAMNSPVLSERRPQVESELNEAVNALDRLQGAIERLDTKLTPIRLPRPTEAMQKDVPVPTLCAVANMVYSLTRRIHDLSSRIDSIVSEVEV